MGRRSRKRRPAEGSRAGRTEARNAEARAGLEPLAEGERPKAVTVGAIVALVLAVANIVAGFTIDIDSAGASNETFAVIQSVILLVAAAGMWRARYWAVLGFQALLALQILNLSLALIRVESLWLGLGIVVVVAAMGYLFWKLIRALARIQMPARPGEAAARRP